MIENLTCPVCDAGLEVATAIRSEPKRGQTDLVEGFIQCVLESHLYPVVDGVAIFVEDLPRYLSQKGDVLLEIIDSVDDNRIKAFFAEQFAKITELETGDFYENFWKRYIWTHYQDVTATDSLLAEAFDNDSSVQAFTPRALIGTIKSFITDCDASLGVDIGCAAGGNTHVIAETADLAMGVDTSFMLVRAAREIRDCDGRYEYEAPLHGKLTEMQTISVDIPAPDRTEFFVADANALPLSDGTVDIALSVNLIDVLRDPIAHLEEIDDILNTDGRFVICDPFAWHRAGNNTASSEQWIGGIDGERSEQALRDYLTDELDHEIIKQNETVPWTLKNYPRSYQTWIVDCVATEKQVD